MREKNPFPKKDGWFRAFAPATVANFGSGFDVFAAALCAVHPRADAARAGARRGGTGSEVRASREGPRHVRVPMGDCVAVRRTKRRGVRIVSIEGDGGRLPRSAARNCASSAAAAVLRTYGVSFGLDLALEKGLPLSSGLGSSAASAAAGAYAAALAIAGRARVDKHALLAPSLAGEHVADGAWHGDNVWASLMGGGILVLSNRPAEIVPLESPPSLKWVIVHPDYELSTRRSRAVLPRRVSLQDAVHQTARFASFVEAWRKGDRRGIGEGLVDRFAVPRRARLLPGFEAVRRAALRAGAHGVTFAGAGPSVLIVSPEGGERAASEFARRAFRTAGLDSTMLVCAVDVEGAREV